MYVMFELIVFLTVENMEISMVRQTLVTDLYVVSSFPPLR